MVTLEKVLTELKADSLNEIVGGCWPPDPTYPVPYPEPYPFPNPYPGPIPFPSPGPEPFPQPDSDRLYETLE